MTQNPPGRRFPRIWLALGLLGCSPSAGGAGSGGTPATGGMTASGGAAASGGMSASGGSVGSGGAASGGRPGTGGATGGDSGATGGRTSSGGTDAGASGGIPGGAGRGGTGAGGGRGGGAAGGRDGASGGATGAGGTPGGTARFFIGADVTDQETAPDATRANLLTIMKAHGFNAVRLRTFVDPKAADGYDKTNGYADIVHTVAFGRQIKDAGLALLVDFHYSDNWADPGKQCVPIAWQSYTTISDLARAVHDYTRDSIQKLVTGGARPDLVQIGNETTPGMLIHRCDSAGQPTGMNPITGQATSANWSNLGALLKAGVDGVREVDAQILVAFHIDRGGDKPADTPGAALQTSINWITQASKYTTFDAFGESCYQRYQGDPNSAAATKTGWMSTFTGLASMFPELKLFSAEYGPMQREINDVVFGLARGQGIGTFNWEPTTQGDWNTGHDLLRRSGSTYTAQPDLSLYDQMKLDYASRL